LEVVKERDQVADDVEDGVGGGVGGHGRVAVATEVGGQRAEAAGGERGHLVAPREPELREAVDEEDRRRVGGAALGDVEGNAVDVRGPVPHLALGGGGGFGIHAFRCSARLTRYLLLNGCAHFHKYKSSQPPGSFWITCSIAHASIGTLCLQACKAAMTSRSNTSTQALSTKYFFCHVLFLFVQATSSQQMPSSQLRMKTKQPLSCFRCHILVSETEPNLE
jgi:hypothetical protein